MGCWEVHGHAHVRVHVFARMYAQSSLCMFARVRVDACVTGCMPVLQGACLCYRVHACVTECMPVLQGACLCCRVHACVTGPLSCIRKSRQGLRMMKPPAPPPPHTHTRTHTHTHAHTHSYCLSYTLFYTYPFILLPHLTPHIASPNPHSTPHSHAYWPTYTATFIERPEPEAGLPRAGEVDLLLTSLDLGCAGEPAAAAAVQLGLAGEPAAAAAVPRLASSRTGARIGLRSNSCGNTDSRPPESRPRAPAAPTRAPGAPSLPASDHQQAVEVPLTPASAPACGLGAPELRRYIQVLRPSYVVCEAACEVCIGWGQGVYRVWGGEGEVRGM